MIKIAICDDEKNITIEIEKLLQTCCEKVGTEAEIDIFYDGKSMEDSILQGVKYDLLYLDIQMKNQDGIITAKNIRKLDSRVLIIYVSGYEKYIEELFEVDTLGFVRKPIDIKRFEMTFLRAYERICSNVEYFEFCYKNKMIKVSIGEIVYFESKGRQIQIHMQDKRMEVFNGKVSEVEKIVSRKKIPFIRIHQSFLVNFHAISSRTKTEVRVITGESLPISKDKQRQFLTEYCRLLGGEVRG